MAMPDVGQPGAQPGFVGERVRASVVLPVRDGEAHLAGQLEALAAQRCDFSWEVIVVDNGSRDRSAETAREYATRVPRLQVLFEPRVGKSYALNTGIAAAVGEDLVLVDADDEVGSGYLAAMVAGLEAHELVSARLDTTRLNPPWAQGALLPSGGIAVFLDFLPYVPGALIGIRASACERVGPFETGLSSAEDVDFTWRAYRLGMSPAVAEGAVLHFRRPPDAWGNFAKARSYNRSHVWLYLRYRPLGMRRRSLLEAAGQLKAALAELARREDHWQWRMAWELGALVGRLEESARQRTWYP